MPNNLLIPKHTCAPFPFSSPTYNETSFCRTCGLFLDCPQNPQKITQLFRSTKFNERSSVEQNPQKVFSNLIKKQCKNRFFNQNACHVEFRLDLIDFVEEIGQKLNYRTETTQSAILLMDAVFSLYSIKEDQMKMVAFISLHLAAKMGEATQKIPRLSSVGKLFKKKFSLTELEECERSLFKILQFDLNVVSPTDFASFFLAHGAISLEDLEQLIPNLKGKDTCYFLEEIERKVLKLEELVYFYINASLSYYEFYQFTPIAIAASAILCSRRTMGLTENWPDHLIALTKIKIESISRCAESLLLVGQNEINNDFVEEREDYEEEKVFSEKPTEPSEGWSGQKERKTTDEFGFSDNELGDFEIYSNISIS